MKGAKTIIWIESIVIVILLLFIFLNYHSNAYSDPCIAKTGATCLLSPRIYTGIIQPENHLVLNFIPLKNDIANYIQNVSDNESNISIFVLNLKDSASFGIDANHEYPLYSLNKLPIAMLVLEDVEKGNLTLETELPILPRDRDPNYGSLYASNISELPVKDLIYDMLAESDDTAAHVLEERTSISDLGTLSNYLDYYTENISYYEQNQLTFESTPKSISNIFLSLYLSTILNPADSTLILTDLTNSSLNMKGYANITDPNTFIAQKDGDYFVDGENSFHTCGIIYIDTDRILYCIMSQGLDEDSSHEMAGTIVNKIYNFIIASDK